MYKAIRQVFNSKILLFLQISGCTEQMWIIPSFLGLNDTVVTNIFNVTVRIVTPRQPTGLQQSRSLWIIILLASPNMKLHKSSPILPAFEPSKLLTISSMIICVSSLWVTSIMIYLYHFLFLLLCVCVGIHFLCIVLRVHNIYLKSG